MSKSGKAIPKLVWTLPSLKSTKQPSSLEARTIVVHRGSLVLNHDTSFRSEKQLLGPEKALINSFVVNRPFPIPKNKLATIFVEPRIESGYPDLVIVLTEHKRLKHWNPERDYLVPDDFRLLHLLVGTGKKTNGELNQYLGRQ